MITAKFRFFGYNCKTTHLDYTAAWNKSRYQHMFMVVV